MDATGRRVDAGGLYRMTTLPDGRVNEAGIATFAASAVEFLRRYDLDGLDVDFEYPCTAPEAGNPLDLAQAAPRRAGLPAAFEALLVALRGALDEAAAADGRPYLLSAALPAAAWLLDHLPVRCACSTTST